jgi:hypothetical protein
VSTELANKACAYLLIAPMDATGPATEADLFVYNTIAKMCYTSIVFIKIIINTNVV